MGGFRAHKLFLTWLSCFSGNLISVLSLTDRGCNPRWHGASLQHPRLGGGLSLCTACSLAHSLYKLMDPLDLIPYLALQLGYEEEGALPCAPCAPASLLYVVGAPGCAFPMVNWKSLSNGKCWAIEEPFVHLNPISISHFNC